jgi:dihydroorotate dehydrogenase
VFVKIAPDLDETQVEIIATTLMRYGADSDGVATSAFGVIATNTTLSREAVAGLPHAQETGGLSGAPVLQASNRVIRQLRACLGKTFPIVGVGGVMSADDAVSKIQSGANIVQIYTGLIYQGPSLVWESARAIQALADS